MSDSAAVRFSLLGAVRGWRGGEELALAGPQQRATLAMLVVAAGQPVAIEELIDGLWGDHAPKAAATTVRTYISRIRTVLAPEHRAAAGPGLLVSVGTTYALQLPPGASDVIEADREAAAAADARQGGEAAVAHRLLRRAVGRWQGVPLTGLTGPFAVAQRERLTQRYLDLLESRIELDLELGHAGAAVADLTAAIAGHPLRESLRLLLMRALYQCGRQAEALAVFADTRTTLAAELGIDPDPRLGELHERILRSDPDLLGVVSGAPAPATVSVPAQLPTDIVDFTGRTELVAELTDRLTQPSGPAVRICAISGIGGAGKTSLAVHVAHALRPLFPAGQLFVDLAGVQESPADPAAVLASFLHALGVPETAVPDGLAARSALYRTTLHGRRVLVVLDNATDAEQIRQLLPGYPGCAVIVTSRARMTAVPSHPVDLDPLAPAEAMELFTAVVGRERVAAEPEAAQELLASCGHLPLAVRVIACRLLARPGTSIAECLRRLGDERRGLDELRTGDLNVQACFRLGYDQLDPSLARAFRLLALPDAATVSLSCAAALLGVDAYEAEDVLDALLDASLVQSPRSGSYRYHDLLRLFARRLSAEVDSEEETTRCLANLLDFLLATVRNAYRVVRPGHRIADRLAPVASPGIEFPDAPAAHAWFDRERDFLLSVLGQTVRRAPSLVGTAADVLLGLDPLFERTYAWYDIVELAQAIAEAARCAGLAREEAGALYMLAGGLWQISRSAEATAHIERAEAICRDHDDLLVLAEVLTVRALVAANLDGHDERTLAVLTEARACQHSTGNLSAEANTLGNLTFTHIMREEPAEAIAASDDGLALYRRLGDPMGEAQILIHRGTAWKQLGDTEAAMRCYAATLELSRELDMRYLEANILHRIAETHLLCADAQAAAGVAEQAVEISRETAMTRAEARALATLGEALAELGQRDRAIACVRESVALYGRLGLAEGEKVEQTLLRLTERQ
ncbi:BTAD domain-containing putative transcriptional regulator [Streptomyces sp. NPDC005963]|uniref:AfsR/SARP family transcriptional regulator n=1 Tax=Streptomyces sp. NPDC005963 TaxID=3156721 RepID=UPI0033EBBE6F